ncbi:ferric reductase-like transmembrane domain-containing protein [Alteriqipengyuania flavescens]|uniref:sulfite oxidase heme-binding subunit YedZ n=1 Tax=Alteriqipengyuania flavescens TaxID=3053610 RepID=UPI0025B3ED51|nr:ferric reductase-like transmembrane domain-containing protein [Alteriqipengyuania flavescens]WJY19278.1 ferric reductase-like transmembrane domain-containing protein [Alteriqipengyuania flavescens]WJY25219.1 ferric reductase-like transmembrane domain-containing protein [Alteriqipengyuania flavescens]
MPRPLLWLALSLPGAWMLGRWGLTPDAYGYGHAIADSGDWAAWLLMATLAVTPVRLLFKRARWTSWLARRRRDLGVASFAYAAGHTAVYLWKKGSLAQVVAEMSDSYLIAGWLALALFLPLAITSNDASMRALKRKWKTLHRLVYPAAILTFLHWIWSAFDPTTAWFHAAVLAAIETARIVLQRRGRPRRR